MKKLNFWWSIPQKRASIGHFGVRDDPTIRTIGEMGLLRLLRPVVAEADEVNEAAQVLRPEKLLPRTSESSRFLNSTLFWCFDFFLNISKISHWILAPFLSEAVKVTFLKNGLGTQKFLISKSKFWILVRNARCWFLGF